jgi:glutathione-independent formaldehyde dehydrogenase
LKLPGEPEDEMEDDFLLLSDIFPTGWYATELAQVQTGTSVAVFGSGPVGLMAAYSALIKGAAEVYVVDRSQTRLRKARSIGAIPINFENGDPVEQIVDARRGNHMLQAALRPEEKKMKGVMCAIDAVGYQARSAEDPEREDPMQTFRWIAQVINPTGAVGCVGVYFPKEPHGVTQQASQGIFEMPLGMLWNKGVAIGMGQTPVKKFAPYLRDLILSGRAHPSFIVSHRIPLRDAPMAYGKFDQRGVGPDSEYTKVLIKPALDRKAA